MRKQRRKFLEIRQNAIKLQANVRFFLTMAAYFRLKNCREAAQAIFEAGWKKI